MDSLWGKEKKKKLSREERSFHRLKALLSKGERRGI